MTIPASYRGGETQPPERLYEEALLEASPHRLAGRLAAVFAESLLNVAEKRGQADEVEQELESLIRDVFDPNPELESLLANPAVHRKHKLAIVEKALTGKVSPLVEDFLKLLCHHDRMQLLRMISVSYQALRDRLAKRIRILVESAIALEKEQLDQLRQMLTESLGQDPVLINRVRRELLGGVRIHVGDTLFDSTVLYRLETLRTQFLSRGSHEIQTGRDRFSSN